MSKSWYLVHPECREDYWPCDFEEISKGRKCNHVKTNNKWRRTLLTIPRGFHNHAYCQTFHANLEQRKGYKVTRWGLWPSCSPSYIWIFFGGGEGFLKDTAFQTNPHMEEELKSLKCSKYPGNSYSIQVRTCFEGVGKLSELMGTFSATPVTQVSNLHLAMLL